MPPTILLIGRHQWSSESAESHRRQRHWAICRRRYCTTSSHACHSLFLHVFLLRALCSGIRNALSDYFTTAPVFLISFKETLKTEQGHEEESVSHAVCDEEWNLHKVHQFRGLSHTVLAVGNGFYWVSVAHTESAVKCYVLSPTCPTFQAEIPLLENHTPADFYAAYVDDEKGCFGLIRASKENPGGHIDMYSSNRREWSSIESPDAAEMMLLHRHTNADADREMDCNSANSRSCDWERALPSRRAVFCMGCLVWTYAQYDRGLCIFGVGFFRVWDRSFASVNMPEDYGVCIDFHRPILMPGLFGMYLMVGDFPPGPPECWSLTGRKDHLVLLEEWSGKAWKLSTGSYNGSGNEEDENAEGHSSWFWEKAWELQDEGFYGKTHSWPGVSCSFARFYATNENEWMICRVPGMNISSLPPWKYICIKDSKGKNVCSFFKSHVMNVLNPSSLRNVSIEGIWAIECNSLRL